MRLVVGILVLFTMAGFSASAKRSQLHRDKIPDKVQDAFSKKYPNADVKRWSHKNEDFSVRFSMDDKKYEAILSERGKWIRTEDKIRLNDLPAPVQKAYFSSKFHWLNLTCVKELRSSGNDGVLYLLEGDNWNVESDPVCRFKLYFNADGTMIKKESGCP